VSPKLTPKGAATRQRIIEGAAAEIRERGVAVTTLDDVRARTGTSKSQLFHYFPDGKEELLLAVARFEADQVLAVQQPQLGNLTSWAAWQRWRDTVVSHYDSRGQQGVRPSRIDRRESGGRTKECLDDLIVLFRFTRAGCVNESSARRHRIGSVAKHAQLSVGKRG